MCPCNHKQKPDFSTFLPSEIIIDILSRLPIRTIVICKCVCKSWRDLLGTPQFADFHLSKSVSGLVISWGSGDDLKIFELDNELGLQHHDLQYKPLTKIDSVELTGSVAQGSTNGLLLLSRGAHKPPSVCNPITREYIELPFAYSCTWSTVITYGFGVSKMTGQYKVVTILQVHDSRPHTLQNVTMSICLVYTLGTGIWRAITPPAPYLYVCVYSFVVCLNGNLHWLVGESEDSHCILRFDLEIETFSTLSLPSPFGEVTFVALVVLGGCLGVSDNTCDHVIWLMKEYGNEKSWTTESVIEISPDDAFSLCRFVNPIKVFKDGDILMALQDFRMIYYSNKTKTAEGCELFGESDFSGMKAMVHSSSFLSLNSFANETVNRY